MINRYNIFQDIGFEKVSAVELTFKVIRGHRDPCGSY